MKTVRNLSKNLALVGFSLALFAACSGTSDTGSPATGGNAGATGTGGSGTGGDQGTGGSGTGGDQGTGGSGTGGDQGTGGSGTGGDQGDASGTGGGTADAGALRKIGGGCTTDAACVSGLTCDVTLHGGMCTKACTMSADCGTSTVSGAQIANVCFNSECYHGCSDAVPCNAKRTGWTCQGAAPNQYCAPQGATGTGGAAGSPNDDAGMSDGG